MVAVMISEVAISEVAISRVYTMIHEVSQAIGVAVGTAAR
jgi:hypothetical protein